MHGDSCCPIESSVGQASIMDGKPQEVVGMKNMEYGKKVVETGRSLVDIEMNRPQLLPRIDLLIREPRLNDGEIFFIFSKAEIKKFAEPFHFSVILKFLYRSPFIDIVRGFIKSRWNLHAMPMVGQLRNLRNLLVRLTNEEDFISVMARGNADIQRVPYKVFHWTLISLTRKIRHWFLFGFIYPVYLQTISICLYFRALEVVLECF